MNAVRIGTAVHSVSSYWQPSVAWCNGHEVSRL